MPKQQQTYTKRERLLKPQSFQQVYKSTVKYFLHGLCVFTCSSKMPCSRIGVSISKKQIRRAVDRNRIKRLVREFFRLRKNELSVSLDMVFVVYSSLLQKTNAEIIKCLEVLWAKLCIYSSKEFSGF